MIYYEAGVKYGKPSHIQHIKLLEKQGNIMPSSLMLLHIFEQKIQQAGSLKWKVFLSFPNETYQKAPWPDQESVCFD